MKVWLTALVIVLPLKAQELPDTRAFHDHLWRVVDSYPTDGTHTYHWPKQGSWAGVTRDLHYGDERVAEGDPEGRCYCCGLTFEVFFLAWQSWCEATEREFRIGELRDAAGIQKLRHAWFGSDGNRRTLKNAIVAHGIGFAVDAFEAAMPGDFVQLWRNSGSGHSVVFVEWVRDAAGAIAGLRYWSTQKSTNGIGERTEMFGGERGIDPKQLYIARIGQPSHALRFYQARLDDPDRVALRVDAIVRRAPDVIGLAGSTLPDRAVLVARFGGYDIFERDKRHLILMRRARVKVVNAAAGRQLDLRTQHEFTLARRRARSAGLTDFGGLRLKIDEWAEFAPTERGEWNEVDLLRR